MKRILLAALLAPSLLAGPRGSADHDKLEQPRQLTLRVYNYGDVEDAALSRARRVSNRIFARLGIQTDWLNCPTSPEEIATNRACAAKPGPDHLILKLLPKAMSKKYEFKRGIFGFALPTAEGVPGTDISLFYQRVLDLAYHGGVGTGFDDAKGIILGHMIAHEVGHLLLGPDSHGSRGVMSFPWNKRTLTTMERGLLEFTAAERSSIHRELDRRVAFARP
jgi:hypothetical protein